MGQICHHLWNKLLRLNQKKANLKKTVCHLFVSCTKWSNRTLLQNHHGSLSYQKHLLQDLKLVMRKFMLQMLKVVRYQSQPPLPRSEDPRNPILKIRLDQLSLSAHWMQMWKKTHWRYAICRVLYPLIDREKYNSCLPEEENTLENTSEVQCCEVVQQILLEPQPEEKTPKSPKGRRSGGSQNQSLAHQIPSFQPQTPGSEDKNTEVKMSPRTSPRANAGKRFQVQDVLPEIKATTSASKKKGEMACFSPYEWICNTLEVSAFWIHHLSFRKMLQIYVPV